MAVDNYQEKIYHEHFDLKSFIERITRADGQLIPLSQERSRLGEPLFISARLDEDETTPGIRYLIIDVFAQRGEALIPVGIYDWEIVGDRATGNKQRHQHLPCFNEAQLAADRYWNTGEAFHVRSDIFLSYALENGGFEKMSEMRKTGLITSDDQWQEPIYQNRGIGSLMIAVSAIILDHHGILEMNLGTLNADAKRAWKKFGRGERLIVSSCKIAESPVTRKVTEEFLTI